MSELSKLSELSCREHQRQGWLDQPFRLHLTGVNVDPGVIARSATRAAGLGMSPDVDFQTAPLPESVLPDRLHAVLALHACDTATDEAMAAGLIRRADLIAVAPCFHAELSRHFQESSTRHTGRPLAVIMLCGLTGQVPIPKSR